MRTRTWLLSYVCWLRAMAGSLAGWLAWHGMAWHGMAWHSQLMSPMPNSSNTRFRLTFSSTSSFVAPAL